MSSLPGTGLAGMLLGGGKPPGPGGFMQMMTPQPQQPATPVNAPAPPVTPAASAPQGPSLQDQLGIIAMLRGLGGPMGGFGGPR